MMKEINLMREIKLVKDTGRVLETVRAGERLCVCECVRVSGRVEAEYEREGYAIRTCLEDRTIIISIVPAVSSSQHCV